MGKQLPETILAKVKEGFRSNTTGYEVLHLHTTNKYDRLSTMGTYYYDDNGDEIPDGAIIEFVDIKKLELKDYQKYIKNAYDTARNKTR